jgi:hypothetical protein
VIFDYIYNVIIKTTRGTLNDKADQAEGLLRNKRKENATLYSDAKNV